MRARSVHQGVIRALLPAVLVAVSCARSGDRGLASIRTEKILADVAYVACDDMGGRDTPSVGQRLAARFIRNRMERLGWRPGARDGWFHTFDLDLRTLKESACRASAANGDRKLELAFGVDYSFAPQQVMDLNLEADVLHWGPVPAALDPAVDVKGKWVLFTEPGGNLQNLESPLLRAGAVGVLTTVHVITNLGPDPEGGDVFKLFGNLMRTGRLTYPEPGPILPRVYLKKTTIKKLLALAGVDTPAAGMTLSLRFAEARGLESNRQVACENILAFWPGRDPERSKEIIIVSAHYDHVGVGRRGQVHNGADDNGSGTVALLALAEALAAHGPVDRSILLAWLSAEELGLWGSRAWVENPWFPGGGRGVGNINLDMIGRNAGHQILITPFDAAHPKFNALAASAKSAAAAEGFTDVASGDGYFERSDQANFAKLGIPVVFLTNGMHPDYHEPTDDPEKIDGDKIRRVARTVFRMLTE